MFKYIQPRKLITLVIILIIMGQFCFAQQGAWISHTPPTPAGGTWYSDAGGNCAGTVPASSQYAFFFDINIGSWTEVTLDTIHNFWGLDACGNVAIAYSDNIVIGYSSITSTWDTISYSGTALSPTQNGLYRSWGCSENLAYFVTDAEYFVFDGDLGSWQSLAITMPAAFYGVGFFWAEEDYCGVVLNVSAPDHDKNLMYSLHTHSFNQIDQGGDYNHDYSGMTHGFVAMYNSGIDNNLYAYSAHNNTVTEISINGHYIYGGADRGSADKYVENTVATFGYNVFVSSTNVHTYLKGYDTRLGAWTEIDYSYDPNDWYGVNGWVNGGELAIASEQNLNTGSARLVIFNGKTGNFEFVSPGLNNGLYGYLPGGTVFAAADDSSVYFYTIEGDTGVIFPRRWQSPLWVPGSNYMLFGTYNSGVSDSMDLYIYNGSTNNTTHTTTWRTNQVNSTPYFCAFATGGTGNHSYFYSGILDNLSSYSLPSGFFPGFYVNEKLLSFQTTDFTLLYNAETGSQTVKTYSLGGNLGNSAVLYSNGSHDMEAFSNQTNNWSTFTIPEHLLNCSTTDLIGLAHCRDGATWTDRYYAYNGYYDNIVYLDPIGASILYSDKVGNETILIVRDSTMYAFHPFGVSNIEEEQVEIIPDTYILKQNYPNPFNPRTNIQFSIPKTEFVTLNIYDLLGQEVATIVSDKLTPGEYKYTWDASHFASGVYFYRLQTDQRIISTKKLILLK